MAQGETYVGMGEYQIQRLVRYFTAGAVVKILWWEAMPWWAVFALAPPVLATSYVLGWVLNRYGWVKQAQEVQTLESMAWMTRVSYWWQYRQAKALGYTLNDIPRDRLPAEIEEVMASGKEWRP